MKRIPVLVLLVISCISAAWPQATLRDNFDTTMQCSDLPGRTKWKGDLQDNTIWMIDSNAIRPKPLYGDMCGPDTNIGHGGAVRWDSAMAGNWEFALTLQHKTPPNAPQPVVQSNVEFWMSDTQKALYYYQQAGYNSHGYMVYWFNYPDDIGGNTWRWFRLDSGSNEHGFTLLKITHHQWEMGDEAKFQIKKDSANTIVLMLNDVPIDSIQDSAWTDLRFLSIKGGVGHDTRLDDFKIGPVSGIVCPTITVSPLLLSDGLLGAPYSGNVSASGGVTPYAYTVSFGSLPPGITLASDGTLSGVPTGSGTFTFKITADDSNDCSGSRTYSINIPHPVILASAGAHGTITPAGSISAPSGSTQTFTMIPDTGYHVDSLIVDGSSQTPAASYSFTNVSSSHSIRVTFAINTFTISSSAGLHGTISPNGSTVLNYNGNQSYTVAPGLGYHVDSLIVDGTNQGALTAYAFSNVTADHTIRAVFAIEQFTITSSAGANGTISPNGSTTANYGDTLVFAATPATGYHVDSLIVDGAVQIASTSFTFANVTTNHTIRVVFAIDEFTVVSTAGANGTISPNGSILATYGSDHSFTVSANTGYHIDSVFVDGVDQGPMSSYSFTNVTSNHTIHVAFAIDQFTITSSARANGSISPNGSTIVNFGGSQAYTATPATGYHVDSLIVDGVNQGASASHSFTNVTANHLIRVVFAIDQFTITSSSGANGSISPNGSTIVNYNGAQAYTATPATGYHVDSLIVDGVNQGTSTSYSFTNVTANHSIHVAFAIDQFTITSSSGANGSISPNGSTAVNYGGTQAYTATPATGYHVDSLIVDGVNQGAATSHSFTNVTANHSIRVVFAIDQFTITSSSGANGNISPNGSTVVNYGGTQAYTATPATGYHVDSLIVDGVNLGSALSHSFTNVTANHSIRAVFAIDQFTITSSTGANGSISPNGSTIVNYGGTQAYTATPATGYHVDSLIVDGTNQGSTASYSFTNVVENHNIRVVFAINQFTITSSAGSNGSISPNGATNVNYNGAQAYTATPATGYHVDSLIVDGGNQGTSTSYSFTNVMVNHSIRVVFAIDQFTVTSTPGANGSISPNGATVVNYGGTQAYTATPATGYHVDSLIVDGTNQGASTSYSFTNVTANHSIRVVFAIDQFTVTSTPGANGSISPNGATVVNYGGTQAYTATPATGYHVDSLIVDGTNQGASTSYSFTNVTANHSIRVVFAIDQFTITSSAGSNGSISPNGSTNVNYNGAQAYTATPATGYHVDSLIVDGTNQGSTTSYSFTNVTSNHSIRVVFAIDQFTITSSAGSNGSISPNGSTVVNYNGAQAYTATPATGYHVDSLIVDGVNQGTSSSYSFTNVTANHSIRVVFAIDQFTVTSTSGANGSISPNGLTVVNYGGTQTYTATPATGYHVDSLIVDGANQGSTTSYSFTNVTANRSIRVVFAIDQFTITSSAGSNGSISPNGSTLVNYNGAQAYTATPATGYHVDSLIVDGTNQGASTSYSFTNVTANHTIRVVFAINQFTITSSAGSNGSISPNGSTVVNYNGAQAYTATPATGYHVDSLIVDGANQGSTTSYSFTSVVANHNIRVVFAINQFTITSSAGTNGSISPNGSTNVNYNGAQAYTATPATGYHVDSLIVDGANQGSTTSYSFTNVVANHNIRVVFAINQFTITSSSGANGSISPNGSTNVNYNGTQAYTATPATGYHVDSLIVDGNNQGASTSYSFTNVTVNHTIRVVFAIDQFTIASSAGSNGSISPNGSTNVNYNGSQAYTATPATGYHVDSLIVDGTNQGASTSYSFTNVSANHSIRVVFAIDQFTIASSAGSNGSISPNGSTNVNYNGSQAYTATPATGYHVDSLIVDGTNQGSSTSYSFTNVTANHTIRVVFAIDQFAITSTSGANGSISPNGTTSVNYGGSQVYTATPSTGYHVDSLIVDGANQGTSTSYSFTNITADHSIRVVFAIDQFTVISSAGSNGTISPNGSTAVNYGGTQAYSATPATGYHVDSLIVDGTNQAASTSYSFTNVTADHLIRVVFAIDQFTVTSSAGSNGTISPNGSTVVNYGGTQAYSATPATGYHVDSLIVDGTNQAASTSYSFTNVTADHSIRVVFAIDQFEIASAAGAHGSITPNGVTGINYGGNQSYVVTPDTGYHVDSLIVDGSYLGASDSYSFTNVTANHSIRVAFAIDQFTLTSSSGLHGAISPIGLTVVSFGAAQAYSVTADTGYHVDSLIVDGADQGALTTYSFTNVTSNHSIRVVFAIDAFTIASSAGANGSISPLGQTLVNYGDAQAFVVTPNIGHHVDSLIVDDENVGAQTTYSFSNVTANHTIRAVFAVDHYIITASSDANGTISPSGTIVVAYGDTLRFTLMPKSGFGLADVDVDSLSVGSISVYEFDDVTSNHVIRAVFAAIESVRVVVQTRWNLVSVPLTVSNDSESVLFPLSFGQKAYAYQPGGYVMRQTMTPRTGYWVKYPSQEVVTIVGLHRDSDTMDVQVGWNLIGSTSYPVAVTMLGSVPAGLTTSPIFGYNSSNGGYYHADTIQPGHAYWVKSEMAGKLVLSSAGRNVPANAIRIVATHESAPRPPEEVAGGPETGVPQEFALSQNYPNPFNPTTVIRFALPASEHVRLVVYNMLGEEVATLVDEMMPAGNNTATLNAANLPSGIYAYRITAGTYTAVKKMLLVK